MFGRAIEVHGHPSRTLHWPVAVVMATLLAVASPVGAQWKPDEGLVIRVQDASGAVTVMGFGSGLMRCVLTSQILSTR